MFDYITDDQFLLFFGAFYLVLGASCFFAKQTWEDFIALFVDNDALSLVMGILILPIALFIIVFYDNWETLGSIVLMVIGYLALLKSLVLLANPLKLFQVLLVPSKTTSLPAIAVL